MGLTTGIPGDALIRECEGITKPGVEVERAAATAKQVSDELIADMCKGESWATRSLQVEATLQVVVPLAEFFRDREEWDACASWCERAILLAENGCKSGISDTTATCTGSIVQNRGDHPEKRGGEPPPLLSSLLTLKGEMECRMGDFASSRTTLDKALILCPSSIRARQVAFWSAARNPACDESSLSARLSSLMVPCSDLDSDERLEFLASCAALVAGAVASRAGNVVRSIC
ncbi:unnamed protein product [Sphacelaria rigidula]